MQKKKMFFIFLIISLIGWGVIRYGFVIIIYLITPPTRGFTPKEKAFLDSLHKECLCNGVRISPSYRTKPSEKNQEEYWITFNGVHPICFAKKDSLKSISFKIAKEAYLKVNNHSKEFSKYVVYFHEEDVSYTVSYDIEKLDYTVPPNLDRQDN